MTIDSVAVTTDRLANSRSVDDPLGAYRELVQDRKTCRMCSGLVNPATYPNFDTEHIGPWTAWQGRIDADVMVIAQDFGDERYFVTNKGMDAPSNPTNQTLTKLLKIAGIAGLCGDREGFEGKIFLTNVVLCLKQDGLQGELSSVWVSNCAKKFLLNQIQLVRPRIIVCLGVESFSAVTHLFDIPFQRSHFRKYVEQRGGIKLPGLQTHLFAVYHCGRRCLNMTRNFHEQVSDWARLSIAFRQLKQPAMSIPREEYMRCISEGSDVQWRSRSDGPLKRGIVEKVNLNEGQMTYTVRLTHENGIPVNRMYPCHPHATWLHNQNPHLLSVGPEADK